jgi:DNA-binding MarR family transcriptional regulator
VHLFLVRFPDRSRMSLPEPRPTPVDDVDRAAQARALSELLPRFMRVVHALKTQAAKSDARDQAALVLLFPLVRLGPLRQGALAELVHADPSTVSRHVATLVEQGLVQRVADEADGRASRLLVTDAGREALEALRRERAAHFERVTVGWDATDLALLTTLFGRLIDDLAASLPGHLDAALDPTRETR